MTHPHDYIRQDVMIDRYLISHDSEKRPVKKVISKREDLDGELLDTGDRVKRWFKRYSKKRPQFA